jgi:hypothetical protein
MKLHLLLILLSLFTWSPVSAKQVGDPDYQPQLGSAPKYASGTGPRVKIDTLHNNFHRCSEDVITAPFPGRLSALCALLTADGYRVSELTTESLEGTDILVISGASKVPYAAINKEGQQIQQVYPTGSAFSTSEITRIRDFVFSGKKLFLLSDHDPFGGGAGLLVQKFLGTPTKDQIVSDETPGRSDSAAKSLIFTRPNGGLVGLGHPIQSGITRIDTYGGCALHEQLPVGAQGLLRFSGGAVATNNSFIALNLILQQRFALVSQYPVSNETAAFKFQAAALSFGSGRVFVGCEQAAFTAQIEIDNNAQVLGQMGGLSASVVDNEEWARNIFYWLSTGR